MVNVVLSNAFQGTVENAILAFLKLWNVRNFSFLCMLIRLKI